MRSIGAAIIILGSCICFSVAAGFVNHEDTNIFLNGVAILFGVIGLRGWWTAQSTVRDE